MSSAQLLSMSKNRSTDEEIAAAKNVDLLEVFGDLLVKDGLLSEDQLEMLKQERKAKMDKFIYEDELQTLLLSVRNRYGDISCGDREILDIFTKGLDDMFEKVDKRVVELRNLEKQSDVKYATCCPQLSQYLLDCGCDPENYRFTRAEESGYYELLSSDGWMNTHVKHLTPMEFADNKDGRGHLVLLTGGNNQNGETHWLSYLDNVKYLLTRLREKGYQGWVCNIHNVVVGDTHTVILGFRKLDGDLREDYFDGYAPAMSENPGYNHYQLTADISGMDDATWLFIRTFLAGIPKANVTADFDSTTLVIDIETDSYELAVSIHAMLVEFLPKLFQNITGNITGLYRKQSQD